MAFNRNDPADLLSLKTEVNTDPISMGYNPTGPTVLLLKLLNDPDNNVEVPKPTANRPFDVLAMLDALDPQDYDLQQTVVGAPNYVHTLAEISTYRDISPYKAKFRSMFPAFSATVTALDAQSVDLSRAEVLFGQGTVLSDQDWFAARDS